MLIELRRGMALCPGTFNVIIAPERVIVSAINSNADLQRFLFLYVSGNYSRLLTSISRTSKNFEICRAFTAHHLLRLLREAAHTVILLEHDPTLFEGAEEMLPRISEALRDAGRESLVILYSPAMDRTLSALIRQADRVFEIAADEDVSSERQYRSERSQRTGRSPAQTTLEVS